MLLRDAARIFNVSEDTVERWIEKKGLPVHKVNRQYRFNEAELLEWATSMGMAVSPELGDMMLPDTESLHISSALQAGGILQDVPGNNVKTVLTNIVNQMKLPENTDREFLLRVLLAREALGSTGIGKGIAIPHPRSPIVLDVTGPSITLCYLAAPVNFNAIDGQPVTTLFTLISSTTRMHLHSLSRLAYILQDQSFRATLEKRAALDEVVKTAAQIESRINHRSKS